MIDGNLFKGMEFSKPDKEAPLSLEFYVSIGSNQVELNRPTLAAGLFESARPYPCTVRTHNY